MPKLNAIQSITLFTILAFILILTISVSSQTHINASHATKQTSISNLSNNTKEPHIVNENGFKVVSDSDPNRQTIIATIISKTPDKQYYSAVNAYDSSDIVTIPLSDTYATGDKVTITFFHDDIESVEILPSDYAISAPITKEYKVTSIEGNDYYGQSTTSDNDIYFTSDYIDTSEPIKAGTIVTATFQNDLDDSLLYVKVKQPMY